MKKNVGKVDRAIRIVLSLVLAVLYFTEILTGTAGIIAIVAAVVLLLTSFVGFCGLYMPFGISTCEVKPAEGSGSK
jgi:membrane-bound ClpP family serine protease